MSSSSQNTSAASQVRMLKIIHFALMAFPVIALIVLLLSRWDNFETSEGFTFIEILPTILFVIVAIISGKVFSSIYLNSFSGNVSLSKKLGAYMSAHIAQMALYEFVALFAIVICFITNSIYNIGIVVLVLFIFLNKIPTPFKLEDRLNLTPEERSRLSN